jgi:hypothetical protein
MLHTSLPTLGRKGNDSILLVSRRRAHGNCVFGLVNPGIFWVELQPSQLSELLPME